MGTGEDQGSVGGGAFRGGALRPLCASCHEPTDGASCSRCAAPLCKAHAPAFGRRCAACEAEFVTLRRDRLLHPVPTWALFLSYAIASGGVFAGASLVQKLWGALTLIHGVLIGILVLLAGGAPLYVSAFRRGVLRTRFLGERPDQRRLHLSRAMLEAVLKPEREQSRARLAGWVLAAIGTAYGVGSWAMAVVLAAFGTGSNPVTVGSALAVASGALTLAVSIVWLTRDRKRRFALTAELFWLVLVPAWGLLLNNAAPVCDPTGCGQLGLTNRPLAVPGVFGLFAIYGAAVVAYGIARRRPERLGPVAEVLVTAQLAVGAGLCAMLVLHLTIFGFLGVVSGPVALPLAAPVISGTLFLEVLLRRLIRRGREARAGAQRSSHWFWSGIFVLPLAGLWSVLARLLLGAWPLQAFLEVCSRGEYLFAGLTAPQKVCGGHYLCTVAAHGHRWLVRPLRVGRRSGRPILVNRQLALANAFEDLLHERWPRFGRLCRQVYDRLALPVSRYLRSTVAADLVYLAMKPFEWLFALALLLLDRGDPEARIDRMYR